MLDLAHLILPLFALALDALLGDPRGWPHPVRFVGRLLHFEERAVAGASARLKKAAGVLFVLGNAAVVAALVHFLVSIPWLGMVAWLYFAYAGLALGQLMREGAAVAGLLDAGRLEAARQGLARLVSRDVAGLDEAGLRRTLAETVSENVNDGLVAPFFFLAIGGPWLMWAYKTVSTMDSMWGYRNDRFHDLGWCAARLDDVLAFVPARITAVGMIAVGWFMKMRPHDVLARVRADAIRTDSPNAGWPMAAAAWLLGAAVGGPAVYDGQTRDKPILGPEGGQWTRETTARLMRLAAWSAIWCALAMHVYFQLIHIAASG